MKDIIEFGRDGGVSEYYSGTFFSFVVTSECRQSLKKCKNWNVAAQYFSSSLHSCKMLKIPVEKRLDIDGASSFSIKIKNKVLRGNINSID